MRFLINAILICFISGFTIAQNPDGELSDVTFNDAFITQFSEASVKNSGSSLIFSDYKIGQIELKDGRKFKLNFNYDVQTDKLLFQLKEMNRSIELHFIQSVKINDNEKTHFRNAEKFGLTGLAKVQYEGEFSLIETYSLKIIEANYNPALNVGEKENKLKVLSKNYLFYQNELIEIKSTTGKTIKQLPETFQVKSKSFLKSTKNKLKTDDELIAFAQFLNAEE